MADLELDDNEVIDNFYSDWTTYLNDSNNADLPEEAKEYLGENPYVPQNVEKKKDELLIQAVFSEIETKMNELLQDIPSSESIPSDTDIWDVVVNKINSGSILVVPNPDYPATSVNQFILQIAP